MDAHCLDGKLREAEALIHEHILLAQSIPEEQKLNAFLELQELIPNRNLIKITNDFILYGHAPGPNYDPTNDLYADDLLYLCYLLVQDPRLRDGLIRFLNEQFEEMSTGMCPQGRTHRLFSVVFAYREFF